VIIDSRLKVIRELTAAHTKSEVVLLLYAVA
jgi:hypothetical protein